MSVPKFIRRRLFLSREDILCFGSIFSDFVHKRHPFANSMFKNMLYRYFFGHAIRFRHYQRVLEPLTEPVPLYHLTYSSLLSAIRREGLRARDFIFLTDNPAYSRRYYRWKDEAKDPKARGDHVMILIDTAKLLKDHPLYRLKKRNQFLTDSVPPECIVRIMPCPPETDPDTDR